MKLSEIDFNNAPDIVCENETELLACLRILHRNYIYSNTDKGTGLVIHLTAYNKYFLSNKALNPVAGYPKVLASDFLTSNKTD